MIGDFSNPWLYPSPRPKDSRIKSYTDAIANSSATCQVGNRNEKVSANFSQSNAENNGRFAGVG